MPTLVLFLLEDPVRPDAYERMARAAVVDGHAAGASWVESPDVSWELEAGGEELAKRMTTPMAYAIVNKWRRRTEA